MSSVSVFRSAIAIAWLFALACEEVGADASSDHARACGDRPIRMAVASSLRELSLSLRRHLLAQDPSIEVESIFGASSVHARQLGLGAPMDVFVSADSEIVDDLIRRELLVEESRLVFARGQLALVARSNGHAADSGLSALEASKVERLAIPSAAVPLGRYARSWLASRDLLDQFEGRIVVTEHARATLAAVDAGHVDFAIVYRSDLRLAKAAVTLASIDPSEYPPIRYVAARTARAPDCPEIGETIAAWGQPPMQEELARAGFLLADRSGGLE